MHEDSSRQERWLHVPAGEILGTGLGALGSAVLAAGGASEGEASNLLTPSSIILRERRKKLLSACVCSAGDAAGGPGLHLCIGGCHCVPVHRAAAACLDAGPRVRGTSHRFVPRWSYHTHWLCWQFA
jgi:hypothetical protein